MGEMADGTFLILFGREKLSKRRVKIGGPWLNLIVSVGIQWYFLFYNNFPNSRALIGS